MRQTAGADPMTRTGRRQPKRDVQRLDRTPTIGWTPIPAVASGNQA